MTQKLSLPSNTWFPKQWYTTTTGTPTTVYCYATIVTNQNMEKD